MTTGIRMLVFDTVDPGATWNVQLFSLVVLHAPDAVPGQRRHGYYQFSNGISQLSEPRLCFDFLIRMNTVHQITDRHGTLVMSGPRSFVCISGLNVKKTAA